MSSEQIKGKAELNSVVYYSNETYAIFGIKLS